MCERIASWWSYELVATESWSVDRIEFLCDECYGLVGDAIQAKMRRVVDVWHCDQRCRCAHDGTCHLVDRRLIPQAAAAADS